MNHWRLKLLGGSGKARKSETDAAKVVSLGRVCASETLIKDRQSGETSARFLWKMTEVPGATSTIAALSTHVGFLPRDDLRASIGCIVAASIKLRPLYTVWMTGNWLLSKP